jgi:hypothetical protein
MPLATDKMNMETYSGYLRQRFSTIVLRAPESFINQTLWPEFLQIRTAIDENLNEATERIIRDEVYGDVNEAEERVEPPALPAWP